MSCRTKASRSAGAEGVEHDEEGHADGVGQERLVLGIGPAGAVEDQVGHVRSDGSSRRARRERRMFSATRETTVVSQPRRFSTSAVSVRL